MARSESKKEIDGGNACGHETADSSSNKCQWPCDDATCRQDISIPFNILIEFEAPEYVFGIRFVFKIARIFDSSEIPYSPQPYF